MVIFYEQMEHILLRIMASIPTNVEYRLQKIHKKPFKTVCAPRESSFGPVLQLILLLIRISTRKCRLEKP